jgi:HEAT repeat protein
LLANPAPDVRQAAAEALGHLGSEAVRSGLSQLTADGDVEVRKAASRALDRLGNVQPT